MLVLGEGFGAFGGGKKKRVKKISFCFGFKKFKKKRKVTNEKAPPKFAPPGFLPPKRFWEKAENFLKNGLGKKKKIFLGGVKGFMGLKK